MDTTVYDRIFERAKDFNDNEFEDNYGNAFVGVAPESPTYPLTVFDEIRNDPFRRTNIKSLDRVDNLGYEMRVYAQDKGEISKQKIAREIVGELDDFLTNTIGLKQISMNPQPMLNDSSTYGINVRYGAKYFENRAKIL